MPIQRGRALPEEGCRTCAGDEPTNAAANAKTFKRVAAVICVLRARRIRAVNSIRRNAADAANPAANLEWQRLAERVTGLTVILDIVQRDASLEVRIFETRCTTLTR